MHPLPMSLCHTIYPVQESLLTKRDRPLKVLCLGIARSGTDSLRSALLGLGYWDVHHGYSILTECGEIPQWIRLSHLKHIGDFDAMTTAEFDKCLGDCEAVTDIASCFAHELLTAYPDAKVVLNYREDVDKWHASVKKTIGAMETSWAARIFTRFQTVCAMASSNWLMDYSLTRTYYNRICSSNNNSSNTSGRAPTAAILNAMDGNGISIIARAWSRGFRTAAGHN